MHGVLHGDEKDDMSLSLMKHSQQEKDRPMTSHHITLNRECTTIPTSLIPLNYSVLLIQRRPAWALHALLRFHGIEYITQNSIFDYTTGRPLPLLIDGTM